MSPPAARWSLRARFGALGTVVGVLAVAVAVGLGSSAAALSRSMEVMGRNSESVSIARELLDVLYGHALTLSAEDADSRAAAARPVLERRLGERLVRARELADSGSDVAAVDETERRVERYLDAARAFVAAEGQTPAEVPRRGAHVFEGALDAITALRTRNETELLNAYQKAARIETLSTAAGLAAAVFILMSAFLVAATVRGSVVLPLKRIRDALRTPAGNAPAAFGAIAAPKEIAEVIDALHAADEAVVQERERSLASIAGVAHDLRNPLSPMKMGVAMLARDPALASSARAGTTVALLGRQIEHLNRMITDLLDAAQIEAGHLELRSGELDLRDPVREAVDLHRVSSTRHTIAVEVPDAPVVVGADRLRIEQVVGNLLSNAIKYSPDGGEVRVRLVVEGHDAILSVSDRGIGIAPDALESLFAPFVRRPDARAVAPGAGLGLAVVRRIVELHGGTIDVESALDQGSTFRVRLPLSARAEGSWVAGARSPQTT